MSYKKISIGVEGNIGVGKSTFLDILMKHNEYEVIPEPVSVWIDDFDIINKFYGNMKKFAYPFQCLTYITRLANIISPAKKDIRIIERSIFSDRYCFAKNLHDNGIMSDTEWNIYSAWFDKMIEHFVDKVYPDAIIYLYAPPEVCFNRIEKRNRGGESSITLDYLKLLDKYHSDWLNNSKLNNCPTYVVDIANGFTNLEKYEKFIMSIINKIVGDVSNNTIIKYSE